MDEDLFLEETESVNAKPPVPAYSPNQPLAYRMRPRNLQEFVGQSHILDEGKILRRVILADRISSAIFYGPPGCGKTTLAYLIALQTRSAFVTINAVASNVQEMRKILEQAEFSFSRQQKRTILFIDEIHRFNKAQQDILMPVVEKGSVILIGATTHNPSFSINGPLLSRSLIFELKPHSEDEIIRILKQALADAERGLGKYPVQAEDAALRHIAKSAGGDARRALNALEVGVLSTLPAADGKVHFNCAVAEESVQKKLVYYDKNEDYHYDTISAFIKSIRGSDVDAAVYWLAKMLHAGEEMRFIARRLVILAAEDIGNADPQALILAVSAMQACEFVGLPEARIILAQAVTYLAVAPKSNASYQALEEAAREVEENKVEEVPSHLRDAHYPGAKKMGHGEGYEYVHNNPDHFSKQAYREGKTRYYRPEGFGFEKEIIKRMEEIARISQRLS